MERHTITLELTDRQAEALRALAALDEIPPEIYAAEVLVRHLYHEYNRAVQQRTRSNP